MAALDDFPILTGDNVIGVGADAFLMRPKDQMCAFIAVSYTHLFRLEPRPQHLFGGHAVVGEKATNRKRRGPQAVSYTHLPCPIC